MPEAFRKLFFALIAQFPLLGGLWFKWSSSSATPISSGVYWRWLRSAGFGWRLYQDGLE